MRPHRDPVRSIRKEWENPIDQFATLHDLRINEDHPYRGDSEPPMVVVHIGPKSALSETGPKFPARSLHESDVRLRGTGNSPQRTDLTPYGVEASRDPDSARSPGGEHLSLFENGILEIVSSRFVYEKRGGWWLSIDNLTTAIVENLALVISLLARSGRNDDVLISATFLDYDEVHFQSDFPDYQIRHRRVESPVVAFQGGSSDRLDEGSYDIPTDSVKDILRPLYHSANLKDYNHDIPEEVDLSDLTIEN